MLRVVAGLSVFVLASGFNVNITSDDDNFIIDDAVPFDNIEQEHLIASGRWYDDHSPHCGFRGGGFRERIVGGESAQSGEFPWLVSIQVRYRGRLKHICGGTIIDHYWILTAAHCTVDVRASELSVVSGDYNLYVVEGFEQRRQVKTVYTNEFDLSTFRNDIALIRLQQPLILLDGKSAPICLPSSTDNFRDMAIVAGWGRLVEDGVTSSTLQKVALPITNKAICEDQYRRIGFSNYLHQCQICAGFRRGGKDACQGDSGGPLICETAENSGRFALCGIVSWGIGCGRPNYPGVYTQVIRPETDKTTTKLFTLGNLLREMDPKYNKEL